MAEAREKEQVQSRKSVVDKSDATINPRGRELIEDSPIERSLFHARTRSRFLHSFSQTWQSLKELTFLLKASESVEMISSRDARSKAMIAKTSALLSSQLCDCNGECFECDRTALSVIYLFHASNALRPFQVTASLYSPFRGWPK